MMLSHFLEKHRSVNQTYHGDRAPRHLEPAAFSNLFYSLIMTSQLSVYVKFVPKLRNAIRPNRLLPYERQTLTSLASTWNTNNEILTTNKRRNLKIGYSFHLGHLLGCSVYTSVSSTKIFQHDFPSISILCGTKSS